MGRFRFWSVQESDMGFRLCTESCYFLVHGVRGQRARARTPETRSRVPGGHPLPEAVAARLNSLVRAIQDSQRRRVPRAVASLVSRSSPTGYGVGSICLLYTSPSPRD